MAKYALLVLKNHSCLAPLSLLLSLLIHLLMRNSCAACREQLLFSLFCVLRTA